MTPTALASLPRLRWRPDERRPLVPPDVRAAYPALAEDFEILDRELLPRFHELDEDALRAQNGFRLGELFVIVGGAAATALGAVQAALGGGVTEIGIAEAVVAGALAAAVTYVRGVDTHREYLTARLRAERLRGEYFRFLGRLSPYDSSDAEERLRRLRERVAAVDLEEPA